MNQPVPPSLACPQCADRILLPDDPPDVFTCPKCGPVQIPNMDALMHAYLSAAAAASSAPPPAPREPSQQPRIEVRDESGTPLYQLSSATQIEQDSAKPLSNLDMTGLQSLLTQLPQATFSTLLLGQMSGLVALDVAPKLAAELTRGTGKFMEAATGGFHGNVVDTARNVIIGQASFAPISAATLGLAAAWQAVSLVVAQKHLQDINERLAMIERKLDDLLYLSDQDLVSDIRGDAQHLYGFMEAAGAAATTSGTETYLARADGILQAARQRREKLISRLQRDGEKFTPDQKARWFGRKRKTVERELTAYVEKYLRNMVAFRLNAILMAAATEFLRRLGERPEYTQSIDRDLREHAIRDDDDLAKHLERIKWAVMSVKSIFHSRASDAKSRNQIAARVWAGVRVAAPLRYELDRIQSWSSNPTPRLLLSVGEDSKVTSVAWIDQPEAGVAHG